VALLLLIRHGENDLSRRGVLAGRLRGVHLNENGRNQALALATALEPMPIMAIYSSPLERAVETAEPLASRLHLRIRKRPGLLESDVGTWQGKSVRRLALSSYWRVVQQAPSRAGHPGGESFIQTQARVVQTLEAICSSHRAKDMIACFLHSDPIKLAVAHFIGMPLDHFQRLACDPASVTMLQIGSAHARLVWLNRPPPFPVHDRGASPK